MQVFQGIARQAVKVYGAAQNEEELAVVLALADSANVERIVEIGTWFGGTAWAFAQLPSVKQIVTIDLEMRAQRINNKIDLVPGDSSDIEIIARVEELMAGNPVDLLFIDGGHSEEQVRADWDAYGYAVRDNGLVVFHDINEWAGNPEIQVRKAWLQIAGPYPHVEIVYNRTVSPGTGILWRNRS